MPKPIYAMWEKLKKDIGPEATTRIQRFYTAYRSKMSLEDLGKGSWRRVIEDLTFYEKYKRPALRKDQLLIDIYNESQAIEVEKGNDRL